MIPKINLDDRTFDDIFNDALRLIPRYCPEWTNHNTSDPGITLLELFSWMTEMTIYRLNKVPDKTYLSLLELMGLSLVTPQSARAIVQFFPVEGMYKNIEIKQGTQIAAVVSEADDIIFETEKNIRVCNSKLVSCVNKYKENWTQNIEDDKITPFYLFDSKNEIEHALYVMSESFKYLENEHYIQLTIIPIQEINSVNSELVKHVFWEFWDGTKWIQLKTSYSVNNIREKDNTVYFHGGIPIQPLEINGKEGFWVRGILSDIPLDKNALYAKGVMLKTIFGGQGFAPDMCLKNYEAKYEILDMNTSFRMFSDNPQYNECFYFCADDIFSNSNAKTEISYIFSETYIGEEDNKNASFVYEYWNGNDWVKLGSNNSFIDGTFDLKQSGAVTFVIPENISSVNVNNEDHLWIRVRLVTKDFATGGEYVKDDKENWVWKFSSKVQTPEIAKIRIKYEDSPRAPQKCSTFSNFTWKNIPAFSNEKLEKEICLFDVNTSKLPSFYLGFDNSLAAGENSLYFRLDESVNQLEKNVFEAFGKDEFIHNLNTRMTNLCWEYYNGKKWAVLSVSDGTDFFHQSGFVEMIIPEDMSPLEEFGQNLYWIRVTLLAGGFESRPFIKDVLMNAVYAKNEKTYENEIIGSGTGAPGQSLFVAHKDILKGSVLYVNEGSIPSANELEIIRKDSGTEPYFEKGNEVWVRYTEVENFYSSTAFSRHYVIDYSCGKILFGDGARGVNPPKGKFNILMKCYHTGGGTVGNVAKNTLQGLIQSIPFISGCTNPFPAEGGADMETVDSLKGRAAGDFKSLQRAVTCEDFQWLARKASSNVGRAYCLKKRNSKNEVCTVIIPVRPAGVKYDLKLVPSRELLRRVKEFLNERKIVGTPICVQAPVFKEFNITLAITFKSDVIDEGRTKVRIEENLRRNFDCLDGDEGSGWEFGKEVNIGMIMKQLEKINDILSINFIELFDLDANVAVEKILLREEELPFLNNVVIEKR